MSIQRININQQFAQLGIRSSNARMQISAPRGQMSIQNNKTQLQMETQMPTFRIPRERLRSELNLASPLSFAKEYRDKGRRGALQATGTYAAEGDFIANQNIPGDKSIPMMVANKMRNYFRKPETNIGLMPSSPPSLEWTKGHIQVNASRHNITVDWSGRNLADISVDSGYPVEVSLTRRHHVSVSPAGPAVTNNTSGSFNSRAVNYNTYGRYIDRMV